MNLIERCIALLKQAIDTWKLEGMQRNCQHHWETLRGPAGHDIGIKDQYCPKCTKHRKYLEGVGELRPDGRPARR